MVMAALLTQPAPSRGETGSGSGVLVDLSAIDEAIASRRLGFDAARLGPASQAGRLPRRVRAAPPSTPCFRRRRR